MWLNIKGASLDSFEGVLQPLAREYSQGGRKTDRESEQTGGSLLEKKKPQTCKQGPVVLAGWGRLFVLWALVSPSVKTGLN